MRRRPRQGTARQLILCAVTTGKSMSVAPTHVDVVGPGVQHDMKHDLDYLRVVVAGRPDRREVVLAQVEQNLNVISGVDEGIRTPNNWITKRASAQAETLFRKGTA
jgi:hypothetical protein